MAPPLQPASGPSLPPPPPLPSESAEERQARIALIQAKWASHRAPPPQHAAPSSLPAFSSSSRLAHRLTIILTTSPVRSNPDTLLLRRVVHSFSLVPGLSQCPKTVVCDGFRLASQQSGSRYKKGKILQEEVSNYHAFIENVKQLAEDGEGGFKDMRVEKLEERMGFAGAVHRACCAWVETPFVLVVQHDRLFMTSVDLAAALDVMEARPTQVRYIGLRTAKTKHYVEEKEEMLVHTFNGEDEKRGEEAGSRGRRGNALAASGLERGEGRTGDTSPNSSGGSSSSGRSSGSSSSRTPTVLPLCASRSTDISTSPSPAPPPSSSSEVRLRKLWFWYDTTHLCHTCFYQQLFEGFTYATFLPSSLPPSLPYSRVSNRFRVNFEGGAREERRRRGGGRGGRGGGIGGGGEENGREEGERGGDEARGERSKAKEERNPGPPFISPSSSSFSFDLGSLTDEVLTSLTRGALLGEEAKERRLSQCIVKKGHFIEDTFGQFMLTHIQTAMRREGKKAADEVHKLYGAWLLVTPAAATPPPPPPPPAAPAAPAPAAIVPAGTEERDKKGKDEEGEEEEEEEAVVGHLDGRDFLTEEQLVGMGLEPRMRKGAKIFVSESQLRRDEMAWKAREAVKKKEMTVNHECIMSWGGRDEGMEQVEEEGVEEEGGVLRCLGLEDG